VSGAERSREFGRGSRAEEEERSDLWAILVTGNACGASRLRGSWPGSMGARRAGLCARMSWARRDGLRGRGKGKEEGWAGRERELAMGRTGP